MTGKLFLSGGGDEKQTFTIDTIFLKNIKKVLYIPLAWPNDDFNSCLKWFTQMIQSHPRNEKIKINMLSNPLESINLEDYNAVYIGGGNTFKLLKKLKDSKLDQKLIEFYQRNGIIYGGSAGAIILGFDISTSLLCKDRDKNLVGLKDLQGLNLVNGFDIQCHFDEEQIIEHQNYIAKSNRSIIAIPEESALFVENEKLKVIGEKPITLITKNESNKFNVGSEII